MSACDLNGERQALLSEVDDYLEAIQDLAREGRSAIRDPVRRKPRALADLLARIGQLNHEAIEVEARWRCAR